jgi:hypothetical protein
MHQAGEACDFQLYGMYLQRNSQQEYRKCRIYHSFQFGGGVGGGGKVSQPQAKCVFYVMMACRASTGKLRQTRKNVFNVALVRTICTNFSR